MAAHWTDDFCKKVVDWLSPDQKAEVLLGRQWDNHEFRNMVITRAIEICEGEAFAERTKNESQH